MMDIKDKSKCCGCTACASICPKKAIEMKPDEEGFLYPNIDEEKCINCGLCKKVCPYKNNNDKKTLKLMYATRSKDNKILNESTSGGAFSSMAEFIINNGGIVYGVTFDNDFNVVHIPTTNKEEIKKFRGSKYVQSYLNDTFLKIKKDLISKKMVLFSGTPCQIAGLKSFLKVEYENLITVEVICHGTPSPLLWRRYLEHQSKKYNSKIKSIHFRNKTYGYHSGTMKIEFENGKIYNGSARIDYMLKSFFSEISSRPSCYTCKFKGTRRSADISIFDCWHAEELIKNLKDDDKGYTNVMINTPKGLELFENISDKLISYEVDFEKAISLDGVMINNYPIKNEKRNEFYKKLDNIGLENTINRLIKISRKDYFVERIKPILHKFKLLNIIKKITKSR